MSQESEEFPFISIGIPVKDRRWCIDQVVDAIHSIDYPKKRIRLIFVDSSTDGTYEFLKGWAAKHKGEYESVIVEKIPPEGIPKARNACLSFFKGDFLLSVDSDVIVTSDSIKTLLRHFEDSKVGIVGFPYYVKGERGIFRKAWQEWMRCEIGQNVAMGFGMIRASVIKDIGGFRLEARGYEDDDYCCRAMKKGYKVILDTSIFLDHLHPEYKGPSFTQELKENFMKSQVRVDLLIRYKPRRAIRRLLFYSALITSVPLIVLSPIPFLALLAISFIYHGIIMGRGWGRILNPLLITSLGMIWTAGVIIGLLRVLLKRR